MKRQSGIGLTEVLISLFLASMLMTVLIQLYLNNKTQYVKTEKELERRFDVQWVSQLLSDSIRRAGFTPCMGIDQLTVIDHRHVKAHVSALKINQPQQFIQINRMNDFFSHLISIQSRSELVVSNTATFNEKRPLIIADCDHAEIHQILEIEKLSRGYLLRLTEPLIFSYTATTYIGEWLEEQWFIKQNQKREASLYYKLFQTEELTPLIHSLHINNQRLNNKQLLEMILGLDGNKTYKLTVTVRGS